MHSRKQQADTSSFVKISAKWINWISHHSVAVTQLSVPTARFVKILKLLDSQPAAERRRTGGANPAHLPQALYHWAQRGRLYKLRHAVLAVSTSNSNE
jgi:hypothetical protein